VAITVEMVAVELLPRRQGLPWPLREWRAGARTIGDASGDPIRNDVSMRISATDERLYVAVTELTVRAPASMAANLSVVTTTDFAEAQGMTAIRRAEWQLAYSGNYLARVITPEDPLYLGRLTSETTGLLRFDWTTNTNTAVYDLLLRGIWSDEPFDPMLARWAQFSRR